MDIKSKIIKRRSGKSAGKWVVKIDYFDHVAGKTRFMERHADKRSDATDLRNRLVEEIRSSHGQSQTGERMTFAELVSIASSTFYKPAVIVEGRKIDGVRAHYTIVGQLRKLEDFFGSRLIRQLTAESLLDYKVWRLNRFKTSSGNQLRISTVNRELSTMRRLMRFAYSKGWVQKDIFFGTRVIDMAAEMERSRLLNADEEIRLLNACQGEREVIYDRLRHGKQERVTAMHRIDNPKLKAMILLSLDGGMRRGEILKLRWEDFDIENGFIRIVGTHTKTERERLAPLSGRTIAELKRVRGISTDSLPFNFKSFKRSWATATRLAGIDDLQFRDLRRTAITRWQQLDVPLALAGKLAGHTQLQTTMKHYTSTDEAIVKGVSERLDSAHAMSESSLVSQSIN